MTLTFGAEIELSDLDGNNGFVINGIDPDDDIGNSVSNLGDVNGDGIDDFIIGTDDPDSYAGESYVIFGSDTDFPTNFNLSDLDGNNGFILNGIDVLDLSGQSVSGAGDINGDGIDDLIVGASQGDPNNNSNAGESYVIFGSDDPFPAALNLSDLNGSNGFTIFGGNTGDNLGISVSDAGDVNGDGIDDLIVGASQGDPNGDGEAGISYVIFGNSAGFGESLNVLDLNGSNGFAINGIDEGDSSGNSVSSAGDFNGDGIDDLIIGSFQSFDFFDNTEGAYIVFGSSSGFGPSLDLSSINGNNGLFLNRSGISNTVAFEVSDAGDVNGDGFDDVIIGVASDPSTNYAGISYVVFGSDSVFSGGIDLSDLDGSNGFTIAGPNPGDLLGSSVNTAGDINGDGFADIAIGAIGTDFFASLGAGSTAVIFGTDQGFSANISPLDLDGSNGFVVNGASSGDLSGSSVSEIGDVNSDGVGDLIIGAINGDLDNQNNDEGQSFVIYGNIAPELDLNGDEEGTDFSGVFFGFPASAVDSNDLILSDVNSSTIDGVTITLTNPLNGPTEFLTIDTIGNITGEYDPSTGILALSGTDTIANYQEVLQSLQYDNTNADPNTTDRVIEFIVDDGESHSNISDVFTSTISFSEPGLNIDIDGNGEIGALSDGLLIVRSLFGFTGDSLISNAIDLENAIRTTAPEIEAFIDSISVIA